MWVRCHELYLVSIISKGDQVEHRLNRTTLTLRERYERQLDYIVVKAREMLWMCTIIQERNSRMGRK